MACGRPSGCGAYHRPGADRCSRDLANILYWRCWRCLWRRFRCIFCATVLYRGHVADDEGAVARYRFVMLMAGPAANFASLIILGKSHGRKATAIMWAQAWLVPPSFSACSSICCCPAAGLRLQELRLPAAMWKGTFSPLCAVFVLLRCLCASPMAASVA